MSAPIVVPADLGTYLGDPAIDTVRAAFIIAKAQTLCETIVKPLVQEDDVVVLSVAGRAFINVTSAQDVNLGSGHVGYGASRLGGLYLSRADKQTLRRIHGGGNSFVIDLLPKGVSEVQQLVIAATAGTFVLRFNGTNTPALAFDITAPALQLALEAIPSIGTGNVAVTSTVAGTFTFTYRARLVTTPIPDFLPDTALLTGTVTYSVVTPGVYRPGQNMPWWDWQ